MTRPRIAYPLLIGLAGAAGSGKDTAAQHLCTAHGFAAYALASPIKRMLAAGFPEIAPLLDDPVRKNAPLPRLRGITPRHLMQTLGTEWGRYLVYPGVWIDFARERWRQERTAGRSLVITDVRMPDEAIWIRSEGGTVIHLRRPQTGSALRTQEASHISEHALTASDCDLELVNDGTPADLYAALDDAVWSLTQKALVAAGATPASQPGSHDPCDPGPVPVSA